MPRKVIPLVTDEIYHVYNRGVDKRSVFSDERDFNRFLQSMLEFNDVEPIGSLFLNSYEKGKKKVKKLVDILCYCLNNNHYHLILKQVEDEGISEFMKRLNGGYTSYFNIRHKRSGSLFQGAFKVKHVQDNDYLLHLSAYVNLNNKVHALRGFTPKSSFEEYIHGYGDLCSKELILKQFKNRKEYKNFAERALEAVLEKRASDKEWDNLLLEDF